MYYNFDGKEITLEEWVVLFESKDRLLYRSENNKYVVSTVFLGLEHGKDGQDRPLIFESMVFGKREDGTCDYLDLDCRRTHTLEEITNAHQDLCEKFGVEYSLEVKFLPTTKLLEN